MSRFGRAGRVDGFIGGGWGGRGEEEGVVVVFLKGGLGVGRLVAEAETSGEVKQAIGIRTIWRHDFADANRTSGRIRLGKCALVVGARNDVVYFGDMGIEFYLGTLVT